MLSFGGVDRVVGKVTAFARQQLEPTPPIVPLFRASKTRLTSGAGLPFIFTSPRLSRCYAGYGRNSRLTLFCCSGLLGRRTCSRCVLIPAFWHAGRGPTADTGQVELSGGSSGGKGEYSNERVEWDYVDLARSTLRSHCQCVRGEWARAQDIEHTKSVVSAVSIRNWRRVFASLSVQGMSCWNSPYSRHSVNYVYW